MEKSYSNLTVDEFLKNLGTYVMSLGGNEKFLENPAYASIISDISSSISSHIDYSRTDFKNAKVKFSNDGNFIIENNNGYVSGNISTGNKSFNVSVYDTATYGKDSFGQKGVFGHQYEVSLNENASIFAKEYTGLEVRREDEPRKFDIFVGSSECWYDNKGIMQFKEEIHCKKPIEVVHEKIEFVGEVINTAKFNTQSDRLIYYDSTVTKMRRTMLDVASVTVEDKSNDVSLTMQAVPLSTEYGLMKMKLASNPFNTTRVVIPQKTKEEIEAMIQNEEDPKVAEGLRAYVKGRETFYYDSDYDEKFQEMLNSQNQGKLR